MEDQDKAWREIQLLIARDKAAALDELRRRPFQAAEPVPAPVKFRLHPALAAVAASLLLVVALLSFWLLRGSWENVATSPAGESIMSDSFFYATVGKTDTAPGLRVHGAVSPFFAAWAVAVLHPAGREKETRDASDPAAVERGDPEEVRRRIGRVIQEDVFERFLSDLHEFHEKEA